VSGFYFNRFYPDWDEDRTGGRITLGKLLTKEWSVSGAIRLESIELYNPDVPTPALLTAALGENFLSSGRISVAYDTRDTPYLPAEGYFLQGSFEQAFGDFVFSRIEAEARQYWTVHSRPDGGGRHVVSVRGRLGITGDDTPIFERYFAGGYQSFRGYEYRGVGPNQLGVRVGGRFMALGGVQYNMPITADETISAVAFSDFGTIENNAGFSDFRATFGVGLRLLIPAMGPAPIALDWAVPIVDAQGDNEQVFSFYVGLTR
jgi:outer membrane protein insertion porin family